jgi:hypothetical protein
MLAKMETNQRGMEAKIDACLQKIDADGYLARRNEGFSRKNRGQNGELPGMNCSRN